MSLRIRRGTDAQRTGKTFELGEIVYTTDDQQLWVGDGITAGGVAVVGPTTVGYGLTFNNSTNKIEVSGITTDDVSQGINNKYFSTELAVDAAGAALVAGNATNVGITFTYSQTEDDAGRINATVTYPPDSIGLTELVQDTTPELGGDLGLNGNDISGSGNINITGDIAATGDLSASSLTTTNNIESDATIIASRLILNKSIDTSGITIETETGGDVDVDVFSISSFHNDTLPSSMLFSRARGTKASPTTLLNNDFIFSLGFIGRTTNGTSGLSSIIATSIDGTVGNGILPGRVSIRTANASGALGIGLEVDSSQRTTFSGQTRFTDGTAGAPSIAFSTDTSTDTGFFHPSDGVVCVSTDGTERVRVDNDGVRVAGFIKVANVNGSLPASPEAGMIVLDGTIFRGYNGTGWVPLSA